MRQHELITVKLLAIVAVRLGQFRVDCTTGISITLYTNVVAELFYSSSYHNMVWILAFTEERGKKPKG